MPRASDMYAESLTFSSSTLALFVEAVQVEFRIGLQRLRLPSSSLDRKTSFEP